MKEHHIQIPEQARKVFERDLKENLYANHSAIRRAQYKLDRLLQHYDWFFATTVDLQKQKIILLLEDNSPKHPHQLFIDGFPIEEV